MTGSPETDGPLFQIVSKELETAMKTPEQVLAEVAEMICDRVPATRVEQKIQAMVRPFLKAPEPDRLTLAARECYDCARCYPTEADAIEATRPHRPTSSA